MDRPSYWRPFTNARHFESRDGPGDEVVRGFYLLWETILTLTNEVDLLNGEVEDLEDEIFTHQQIKSSRSWL